MNQMSFQNSIYRVILFTTLTFVKFACGAFFVNGSDLNLLLSDIMFRYFVLLVFFVRRRTTSIQFVAVIMKILNNYQGELFLRLERREPERKKMWL